MVPYDVISIPESRNDDSFFSSPNSERSLDPLGKISNSNSVIKFILHLHPPKIPASSAKLCYTFGLGGLSFLTFVITMVTGVLLLFVYSPNPSVANASLQKIATVLPFGWYIRNLHYWSAQVMVVAVVLHLVRISLTGGYLAGRRFNWIIGIILLILTFFMDFTGFPLRWDTESHWALVVGTNLLKTIPWIGSQLYGLIVGGSDISGSTLLRFYTWHIFGLPFIAFFLMLFHFWKIRKDGGISSPMEEKTPGFISNKELLDKEIKYFFIVSFVLILLSVLFTPYLGVSVNKNIELASVNAPWIFLWIQFLLRYLSPFIAGIFLPTLLLVFLFIVPYIDKHDEQTGKWLANGRKMFWMPILLSLGLVLIFTILEAVIEF